MSELILVDKQSGLEVGRREMSPQERYDLYRDCIEHELFTHEEKQYCMHTVAWQVPEENCIVSVTYQAKARMACGCEVGYCCCC